MSHLIIPVLPPPKLVDTIAVLDQCLDELSYEEAVSVAFEGKNLGRTGSLSLIQVNAEGADVTWLLDVTVLGKQALEHEHAGYSVKKLFENENIRKIWWDGRQGCAALFHHYGVRVKGGFDVQLLWHAWWARNGDGDYEYLHGLAKSFEGTHFTYDIALKKSGPTIAGPDFENFERRPLSQKLQKYAAQDASALWQLYHCYMPPSTRKNVPGRVIRETKRRVAEAESTYWDPTSRESRKVSVFF